MSATVTDRLPRHLIEPEAAPDEHVYGTLRYDAVQRAWIVEGEPGMVEVAKRLFPGSASLGRGRARFPDSKRAVENLNWFMLRYPLRILDVERWQRSRQEAVEHALLRRSIAERPRRLAPPATFNGQLRRFQEEGLAFLVHNGRVLLADEQGLGKTPTALAWLASLEAFPALIVVQPHFVRQWAAEVRRFLRLPALGQQSLLDPADGLVHVITGLRPYDLLPANVYIIHYLLLRGWKNILPEGGFRAVVFDEIQELRHTGTEKYSAASLLASSVDYVAGLSGTPIHNHGAEIWNVLNIIEYHCLGDYDSFTREWCTGYGEKLVADPEALGAYLRREGRLLRRTKADVLDELPPKRRFVQEIDLDEGLYGTLIGQAVELAQRASQEKDTFTRGRLMREAVNHTRRATGLAKARYVCAFVKALLDAGESVILYAYHHDVWDVYAEQLRAYSPARITGRETPAEKDRSARAFMAGETNLIMVSLRSASGLNLQRANVVVFGELDWSPAVHAQAEDRAHRMGQRDSVLCYYLVAQEGTDPDMMEALGLKVQQFVGLMGDRPETEQDRILAQVAVGEHMQRVMQRLLERGGDRR